MNSREKGKRGELEVAHILQGYGYRAGRGQQFSGANGDADVEGVDGLHIEVKRAEHLNIEAAMKQAERDARDGKVPSVFHRRNGEDWKVTVRLKDFIQIWQGR